MKRGGEKEEWEEEVEKEDDGDEGDNSDKAFSYLLHFCISRFYFECDFPYVTLLMVHVERFVCLVDFLTVS